MYEKYDELVKRLRELPYLLFVQLHGHEDVVYQAADAIEKLSAKVDSLQIFADNISKLPDCNTCLKQNRCTFAPRWGEYCRINCPAWLGTPEPQKEDGDGDV